MSSDGDHFAYVVLQPRIPFKDDDGSAYRHIYLWDSQRGSRPYVTGTHSVRSIEFSPDGKTLLFLAKREGDDHRALYEIPVDGGESVKLLEHETDISRFAIDPDNRTIAFTALAPSPDREDLEEKGFKAEVYEEEVRMGQLFLWSRGAETPTSLDIDGSVSDVSWSPDGKLLAIKVAPSGLIDDSYMLKRAWVIRPDGSVVQRFANPGKLGQLTWSGDSKAIAMISAVDIHDPREGVVAIGRVKDGELRMLMTEFEGHASHLDWSDPSAILALYDVGTESTMLAINPQNGSHRTLESGTTSYFSTFSRSGDRLALIGQASTHPGELFVSSLTSSEPPKRVTHHNSFLKDVAFGKQEVITVTARDGLQFEGILIRPVDEKPGKRYPLIMCVHGGPESHISNGWLTGYSYPGHMGAARGYAVFYPNYRGSTGKGVAFSKTSQGEPAGAEFDDLVDAVDHLVAMGLVDQDRVGITGGSYGGYATAWASTYYSDRFAAGVMFVGISNKLSKVGTTDIANEEFYVHAMKRPWENDETWKFFLERSPVYHAGKGKTPLLILHGKEDPRVHPSQSMELYRHLKIRGEAPVRLVFYPGEGHGNAKAGARYDYSLRLMRWMDRFLIEKGEQMPPFDLNYPAQAEQSAATEEAF